MPPKKDKFPPQKVTLRQFFKPLSPKTETKDAITTISDKPSTIITKKENEQPAPQPAAEVQSLPSEPQITSSQRIIRDSDDEESDLSGLDSDASELSQPHVTSHPPTTVSSRENGLPKPPSGPIDAQPFSSEPRRSSQPTIEDSDEEGDLSDLDSDQSDLLAPYATSHEPTLRSTPRRGLPTATRTARSRAVPYPKLTRKLETKDAESSLSDSGSPPTTTIKKKNGNPAPKPEPADAKLASTKTEMTTGQQTFGDSSDSDSDLPDIFTSSTTSHKPTSRSTRKPRGASSTNKSRAPSYGSPLTFQPKHKYKFSITSLVSQSQRHEATEASAQRAKSILNQPGDEGKAGQQGDKEALLQSVIAGKDASSADKIMEAVARTEATATEKRWHFFDTDSTKLEHKRPKTPPDIPKLYRKWNLGRTVDRETTAMSGVMEGTQTFQDEMSNRNFLWILEMSCMQQTTAPEGPSFDVLLADPGAIHRFLCPKTVKIMFGLLGALPQATNRKADVEAVSVYKNEYKGRDWGPLQHYISFLGDAAKFATPVTCGYTISLLARLCADSIVKDSVKLLSTVRYAIGELCKAVKEHDEWEISCRQICSGIYKTVSQEHLCLQILECMLDSTSRQVDPRLIDLRKRLSLAVFCQDCDLTQKPAEESLELRMLVEVLSGPRFQVNRSTDYVQLAALISLLGIAIDDGSAAGLDMSDPQVEEEYNYNLDELAYLLKIIWSSINDRGTLSPSRIHAKRTVDKLRNGLLETIRTRPKPKQSIFDLPGQGGDREGALKQSAFMTKHFRKPITNE
ncbi:hypothetical protein VE03_02937 [Pseudogymnoascus sp. 23342-1-I1]|nr:hypothetical protein VE03_02937 [Pseudogymnoascus sp. 23342-1-I1]